MILTEPQWKPISEDQAIARCHRMGQVRSVDVHRPLAEDTVDISDLNAAKEVGSQAEAERRIIELERKRLRMEGQPDPATPAPPAD